MEQRFLGSEGGDTVPTDWWERALDRQCVAQRAPGHLAPPLAGASEALAWL